MTRAKLDYLYDVSTWETLLPFQVKIKKKIQRHRRKIKRMMQRTIAVGAVTWYFE